MIQVTFGHPIPDQPHQDTAFYLDGEYADPLSHAGPKRNTCERKCWVMGECYQPRATTRVRARSRKQVLCCPEANGRTFSGTPSPATS